jgi:hypothetical protein
MRTLMLALLSTLTFAGTASADRYNEHYDRSGEQVVCESRKGRTAYCEIDTRFGVEIIDQLSKTHCIEGENWGYDRRGVWVNGGCRGVFVAVAQPVRQRGRDDGYGRGGYDDGYDSPVLIRCESHGYEPFYCQMPTRGRVQLINQLSRSACQYGTDWGYDRRGVWVANGCRAEFAVQ